MNLLFEKNIAVFALVFPELAHLIRAVAESESTTCAASGSDAELPLELEPRTSPHIEIMLGVPQVGVILQALSRGSSICLFATEVSALYHLFEQTDLSVALSAGLLSVHYLPVTSPVVQELSIRTAIARLMDYLRRGLILYWYLAPPVSDAMTLIANGLRRQVEKMTALLAVPVPANPVYDVIVLNPRCAIFDDVAKCFAELGLRTKKIDVPDVSQTLTQEQKLTALQLIRREPGRLLITRNRVFLETEDLWDLVRPELLLEQKHIAWWWDSPNPASFIDLFYPAAGQTTHLAFARELLVCLPEGSQWLCAGARSDFVKVPALDTRPTYRYLLSFVGQSRLGAMQQNWRDLGHTLHVLGAQEAADFFTADLTQWKFLSQAYAHLLQHQATIDAAIERCRRLLPVHGYYLDYLFRMLSTGLFRLAAVEQVIAAGLPLQLWGDAEWLNVPGVNLNNYRGILPPEQLVDVYRNSQINLNFNFMQVSSTVNPKVLDCAAAGGLVLTDWRPELDILYPDPAVRPLSFRTIEELLQKIPQILQTDMLGHCVAVQHHTRLNHSLLQRVEHIAMSAGLLRSV